MNLVSALRLLVSLPQFPEHAIVASEMTAAGAKILLQGCTEPFAFAAPYRRDKYGWAVVAGEEGDVRRALNTLHHIYRAIR